MDDHDWQVSNSKIDDMQINDWWIDDEKLFQVLSLSSSLKIFSLKNKSLKLSSNENLLFSKVL